MKQTLSTHGIGASEIAAIVGMSPYASPWDVWVRKTGQAPDVDSTPAIEWGHRLEPAIRQAYADRTGAVMYVPSESMFHTVHRWARATPDAIVLGDVGGWQYLVQAKNVGYWPGRDWDDGPPVFVQLQEQWEMFVTGLARADVAALIGGSDYRVYTVHRDDSMIGDLVDIAAAFWRRVETRTPPIVDESTACRDHFSRRLARVAPVELVADEDQEALMRRWHAARTARASSEKTVEQSRNAVLAALDGARADRLVSSMGVAKLARHAASTKRVTNWRYVAELVASASRPPTREEYAEIVEANTVSATVPAHVSLREPREWGQESR